MKLSHKISLYIPSTVNGNVPASKAMIDKFLDMAKNTFANLFGGFTVTPAQGGYMSPEHGLIEEQIQIVYSFCCTSNKSNALQETLPNIWDKNVLHSKLITLLNSLRQRKVRGLRSPFFSLVSIR